MTVTDFGDAPAAMPCTGEGCFCRQGIPVHPPILMIFDRRRGEYVAATGTRCTAEWASAGDGHLGGQICGRPATRELADIWACDHHYKRMVKWINEQGIRNHEVSMREMREWYAEQMRLDRERTGQQIELDAKRVHAEEAARSEYSVVYYVQRTSDGIIKIGTSRGLAMRMDTLTSRYGPLRLLAVHGGTRVEEHEIHGLFNDLLAEGREWFRPALPLLEHIDGVRKRYEILPDPELPPLVTVPQLKGMIRRLRKKQREQAQAVTETAALRVAHTRCREFHRNAGNGKDAGQWPCINAGPVPRLPAFRGTVSNCRSPFGPPVSTVRLPFDRSNAWPGMPVTAASRMRRPRTRPVLRGAAGCRRPSAARPAGIGGRGRRR